MEYGGWLFLIAVGAILRWAVSDTISGVDLPLIGLILIIVGVVGAVISLLVWSVRRRRVYGPYGPGPYEP